MALGDHLYDYVHSKLDHYSGNYLEIGVFNGDGFAGVAKKFSNKICYAVDPFIEDGHTEGTSGISKGHALQSQEENFINNTKNLSNVIHYKMTSVDFNNQLEDSQITTMNISIIVIDGSHHYVDVINDCKLSVKLLSHNKSGIIIFDDLHVQGVKQAYDEFRQEYKNCIEQFSGISGNAEFVKINL